MNLLNQLHAQLHSNDDMPYLMAVAEQLKLIGQDINKCLNKESDYVDANKSSG